MLTSNFIEIDCDLCPLVQSTIYTAHRVSTYVGVLNQLFSLTFWDVGLLGFVTEVISLGICLEENTCLDSAVVLRKNFCLGIVFT